MDAKDLLSAMEAEQRLNLLFMHTNSGAVFDFCRFKAPLKHLPHRLHTEMHRAA